MTNDIVSRVWQHREGVASKFTAKYDVNKLMYFGTFEDVYAAIARETRLKKYKREWKINLIQKDNIEWADLAAPWFERKPIPQDWVPALRP